MTPRQQARRSGADGPVPPWRPAWQQIDPAAAALAACRAAENEHMEGQAMRVPAVVGKDIATRDFDPGVT